MQFIVIERLHREFGDWNYYQITAQTENAYSDNDPQWKLRPKAVAEIQFNCSLEEGAQMPIGRVLNLEPVIAE